MRAAGRENTPAVVIATHAVPADIALPDVTAIATPVLLGNTRTTAEKPVARGAPTPMFLRPVHPAALRAVLEDIALVPVVVGRARRASTRPAARTPGAPSARDLLNAPRDPLAPSPVPPVNTVMEVLPALPVLQESTPPPDPLAVVVPRASTCLIVGALIAGAAVKEDTRAEAPPNALRVQWGSIIHTAPTLAATTARQEPHPEGAAAAVAAAPLASIPLRHPPAPPAPPGSIPTCGRVAAAVAP